MSQTSQLKELVELINSEPVDGHIFTAQLLEDDVIAVLKDGAEQFPVVMTVNENTFMCQTKLFAKSEVPAEKRGVFYEAILTTNPDMPLSDVGIVGDDLVIYGSLSAESKFSVVMEELATLAENAKDAFEGIQKFLA